MIAHVVASLSICLLAAGSEPVYLQALIPTSGSNAEALLDHDAASGWKPAGDPEDEGVLFRFEQPTRIDSILVRTCPGSGSFTLAPYLNGREWSARRIDGGRFSIEPAVRNRMLRSVFLRIRAARGNPCLAEVDFLRQKANVPISPPRSVAGRVKASSTLSPADAYHPGYLFDGRTDFGWVEGAKGLGLGESVTLELSRPVELHALELWNGYQRSQDHFAKNARATAISLAADGGAEIAIQVDDRMGPQKLALAKPVRAKTLRLTIRKAAAGTRYADLVLSELRLYDARGPLAVRTPDLAERTEALARQIAGKPLASIADRQWVSRCSGQRSAQLKLRTNHSFVWYESEGDDKTMQDAGQSRSEVFDGAWVVGRARKPASAVKLYGRRHSSSARWDPYAGKEERSAVRIGGGQVSLTRVADMQPAAFAELLARWRKGPAADRVACLKAEPYAELVERGALLVEGRAMCDLMVPGH
ncbi:MAG: discoidin domain-containing protein [Deltaproteobacteria bacterium]|nr:discoidin domain-containing protein [Deltaproteobacteria bacterium]